MKCEVCNGTGYLEEAIQAWDCAQDAPKCPYCKGKGHTGAEVLRHGDGDYGNFGPCEDGEYVRYEDYAALNANYTKTSAELQVAQSEITELRVRVAELEDRCEELEMEA